MIIENFRKGYEYYKYSDLEHFFRIYPVPKRCSAYTPSGIPCEYYTVPRLIKDKAPAGYTSYTSHTVYDVNTAGELVRVSVRIPKYKEKNGRTYVEDFCITPGEYTHDALNFLHQRFCNPAYLFDDLNNDFPLGKNASKQAFELLLPWAQNNHVFPYYPCEYSFLRFVEIPYKNTTLTFSLTNLEDEDEYTDPSLFDILVGTNYDSLQHFALHPRDNKPLYICIPSNVQLYHALHDLFPDAIYVFDPFHLVTTLELCANEIPADKQLFLFKRTEILDALKKLCINRYLPEKIIPVCESIIEFLLSYKNTQITILNAFRNSLQLIKQQQPDFILKYFEITEFHSFLLFQLLQAMQKFLKARGYDPNRLAYMLLSSIKDLPYVDPYAAYCIIPALMTDEELEEMDEEAERIELNAHLSSIICNLKRMSTGPFVL